MGIIKVGVLNSVSVVVKILCALLLNKVLAIYVGPSGYTLVGQLQNFISIPINVINGLTTTGITKLTAEYSLNIKNQIEVWKTSFRLSLIFSILWLVGSLILGKYLSVYVFDNEDYAIVFYIFGLALPLIALNNLLMAIANGRKSSIKYICSTILSSLVSTLVILVCVYQWGLLGALIGFALSSASSAVSTYFVIKNSEWFKWVDFWGAINHEAAKKLFIYLLMGVTSAIVVPISLMFIRYMLTEDVGIEDAGYWQALWKISEIYLMTITTTLSIYYLPRVAESNNVITLKNEIFNAYKFVLPIVLVASFSVYVLRYLIIETLFTEQFLPMASLFFWQVIGDVMKAGSLVLAFIMLGRGLAKTYIFTEIIFALTFCVLSRVLISSYGAGGVPMAYAINYALYWISLIWVVKKELVTLSNQEAIS